MTQSTATDQGCYHCGEAVGKHPVLQDEHAFCCQGCATVYELLSGSNLSDYYSIESKPGRKMDKVADEGKYAFLELDEIRSGLLEFSDGKTARVTFYVPGIHCSSCIWLLENLHTLHPAIIQVRVHFTRKEASIAFDETKITLRAVVELMAAIGYDPEITLAAGDKKGAGKTERTLYYRLGVAGFCFGNIMLLSFPEYLGLSASEPVFVRFFTMLNLLLALPVFFYSSLGYFSSAWKSLRHGFVNIDVPVSVGILTLFGRSTYEILSGTGAGYMDSLAGLVFFLLVGKWYQDKTYKALSFERDYQSYFPIAVTLETDQGQRSIPLRDLKVGDTIVLRNGELIPADSVLVDGDARIDYSFVTGESDLIRKAAGDSLFAGGRQAGGIIKVQVQKPVEQSYLTRLWNDETQTKTRSNLVSLVDRISKGFTFAILSIALVTGAIWWWLDAGMVWNTVTSVLIVACPCALALTMPFALGTALRIFGRQKFFAKNTESVERMSKVTDIVFDKTGTLTYSGKRPVAFVGEALSQEERAIVRTLAESSTHPLSRAVAAFLAGAAQANITGFEEIPGSGIRAVVNGVEVRLGAAAFVQASPSELDGTSMVYLAVDGQSRGVFTVANAYRAGLDKLLQKLGARFALHLLSGDNDHERENLGCAFGKQEQLHFNQSPEDKRNYINALQNSGRSVLMVGDGLNDAGALSTSDVGISVSDNVFQFSPACDAILDAEQFTTLDSLLHYARQSMSIIRLSFIISFLYNIVGLGFAVSGILTPLVAAILMPLSSVSVVVFVTVAANYAARKTFVS